VDSARHVIGWSLTQETKAQLVFDVVAITSPQTLPAVTGAERGQQAGPLHCCLCHHLRFLVVAAHVAFESKV